MGGVPASPKTLGPPNYANTVWLRATKFGMVKHVERGVLLWGQSAPNHRGGAPSSHNFGTIYIFADGTRNHYRILYADLTICSWQKKIGLCWIYLLMFTTFKFKIFDLMFVNTEMYSSRSSSSSSIHQTTVNLKLITTLHWTHRHKDNSLTTMLYSFISVAQTPKQMLMVNTMSQMT